MKRVARDNEASARRVTRRALLLTGGMAAMFAALGARMRYLGVEQADQFRLLAEENRISIRLVPPTRGVIHDRNGKILAENEQNYRVVMTREDAGDVEAVLNRLSHVIPLTRADIDDALAALKKNSSFVPITVKDRLNWEEFSRVALNAPALPGVTPETGMSRIYPRDAENITPGYITAAELATTPRRGRPTTIYFIDYPSSPLLHRARVAELVQRKINQITTPPLGELAVPMPDVVIGDFNTPRSSASLLRLLPGFWPASDHAGLGLLKTFPRPRCLLHIDNTLVSPTWHADEYGVIDPGISEHKAQRVRLWPKN